MAIKLITSYGMRLGLPGYSSHQSSDSVETALVATDDVAGESERLNQRLQSTLNRQILHTGMVPPGYYGMDPPAAANPNPNPNAKASPANITQVAIVTAIAPPANGCCSCWTTPAETRPGFCVGTTSNL